jgi:cation diffusion facilitator family transporter
MTGGGDGHSESTGAILAAFLANLGIAVTKFIGFLITGASSLLAESIHSIADSSNQGLLFHGGRAARREATPLHPFGFGRSRYFWSFMVAAVLFSVGGLFSIYEGVHKIQHPEELSSPIVAFTILGLAIVFEAFALRTAVRHARPHRGGRTWFAYLRSSRSPELPVLLLEDSAALLGLCLAMLGVGLAELTGNAVWDGIGTLGIGVLLVVVAAVLAVEMKSLLLGEAASPEHIREIESRLVGTPGVTRIIHMLTQHLGPEELLVAVKVEFDAGLSIEQLSEAIDDCERRMRAAVPIARRIYIEPDLFRPEQASGGAVSAPPE